MNRVLTISLILCLVFISMSCAQTQGQNNQKNQKANGLFYLTVLQPTTGADTTKITFLKRDGLLKMGHLLFYQGKEAVISSRKKSIAISF